MAQVTLRVRTFGWGLRAPEHGGRPPSAQASGGGAKGLPDSSSQHQRQKQPASSRFNITLYARNLPRKISIRFLATGHQLKTVGQDWASK